MEEIIIPVIRQAGRQGEGGEFTAVRGIFPPLDVAKNGLGGFFGLYFFMTYIH